MLILFLLKYTKNDYIKTAQTNLDPRKTTQHGKFILQKSFKELLCLMHKFFLLVFVLFFFSLNTQLKK